MSLLNPQKGTTTIQKYHIKNEKLLTVVNTFKYIFFPGSLLVMFLFLFVLLELYQIYAPVIVLPLVLVGFYVVLGALMITLPFLIFKAEKQMNITEEFQSPVLKQYFPIVKRISIGILISLAILVFIEILEQIIFRSPWFLLLVIAYTIFYVSFGFIYLIHEDINNKAVFLLLVKWPFYLTSFFLHDPNSFDLDSFVYVIKKQPSKITMLNVETMFEEELELFFDSFDQIIVYYDLESKIVARLSNLLRSTVQQQTMESLNERIEEFKYNTKEFATKLQFKKKVTLPSEKAFYSNFIMHILPKALRKERVIFKLKAGSKINSDKHEDDKNSTLYVALLANQFYEKELIIREYSSVIFGESAYAEFIRKSSDTILQRYQ